MIRRLLRWLGILPETPAVIPSPCLSHYFGTNEDTAFFHIEPSEQDAWNQQSYESVNDGIRAARFFGTIFTSLEQRDLAVRLMNARRPREPYQLR